MLWVVSSRAVSGDGFEDLVGGLGPDVRLGLVVPGFDPGADVGVEFAYGAVGTSIHAISVWCSPAAHASCSCVSPARSRAARTFLANNWRCGVGSATQTMLVAPPRIHPANPS